MKKREFRCVLCAYALSTLCLLSLSVQVLDARYPGRLPTIEGKGDPIVVTPSEVAPAGTLAALMATGRVSAASVGVRPTNTAAQNDAAIAAAMATLGNAGGGVIDFPCGTYNFGAIDNNVPGVLLRGPIAARAPQDAGTAKFCTHFVATQAGTLLKHRTPYGQGLARFNGGGIENVFLNGNGIATRLLDVDTVGGGNYVGAVANSVGAEAVRFTSGVSRQDVADAADIQRARIDLFCRQIDGDLAAAASCFRLDGSSNANFSVNFDVRLACVYMNGDCLVGVDADNNRIMLGAFRAAGGTGRTLYGFAAKTGRRGGFRDNTFVEFAGNGPSYVQGTNDGGDQGVYNTIGHFEIDNGTVAPTAGTGSIWYGEFRQTYTPSLTCGGVASKAARPTATYVRRSSREISIYFDATFTSACNGGVTFTLPAQADLNYPSTGTAIERAASSTVYSLLVAPASTSAIYFSISSGAVVSIKQGSVVAASLQYLTAY